MEGYSELTKVKIRLYFAANYLFDKGKSHPQVVEMLSEQVSDSTVLVSIVDSAMRDQWRKIFNEVQRLISQGKNYQEILDEVTSLEPDLEIIRFIYNTWYDVQALYAENVIEFKTNIWEGVQWIVICSLGLIAMFYFNSSLLSKIIWALGLLAALVTWVYGLHQKKLAKGLKKILEEDYTKFDKII